MHTLSPRQCPIRLGVALAIALVGVAFAAEPDDPFSAANEAKKGKATKPEPAKDKSLSTDATANLIRLEMVLDPAEGRRGETVRLTITGTPKDGYHTYPITQRSEDPIQDPSGLSKLVFGPSPGLKPLTPIYESESEFVVEKGSGVFLEHRKVFTWAVDILVLPNAKEGEHKLPFTIQLQLCDEKRCVPGKHRYELPIRVSNLPAVPVTADLQRRPQLERADIKTIPVPEKFQPHISKSAPTIKPPEDKAGRDANEPASAEIKQSSPAEASFFQRLLLAMSAGFIMLLTPCVFPMIPVTVSFFLKQGEKEHNSPLVLATVYSGTIVVVLTLAVLLLGNLIISWANNVWLNLAMGVVLVFFALSLFGMFEIELPHFLTRFTSAHEGTGYVGAFFMALTFTVNSFTCTGPFLGPLLAAVKELKMSPYEVFASALAYSAAFAAPFFLLAIFPRMLKALPKSGGWLNAVKVVMGFLELALALKFFSISDNGFFPGNPRFFNYETVLCTWIALAIACGLYLFGIYRLPHDTPVEHIGVPRLLFATFCFGLALYMTPLLQRKAPLGAVGEFIIAWLPQDTASTAETAKNGTAPGTSHLAWTRNYEKAWQEARASGKLLFIDFTGINCINCRFNEQTVFPRQDVRAEMEKFVRVQLYTDVVPDRSLSAENAQAEAERNLKWQESTFGDISLPLYVVIDPAGAEQPVSVDNKLTGTVKGRASGTINDVPAFVDMLRKAAGQQVASRE